MLGQTPQPSNDEDGMQTDLHFSCFVAARDICAGKEGEENLAVGSSSNAPTSPPLPGSSGLTEFKSRFANSFFADPEPKEGQLEGMRLIELDGRRPFPIDHGRCVDVLDVRLYQRSLDATTDSCLFPRMLSMPLRSIISPKSSVYTSA